MSIARIASGTSKVKQSASGRWLSSGRDAKGKRFIRYFATKGEAEIFATRKLGRVTPPLASVPLPPINNDFQKQFPTVVAEASPPITSWASYDPSLDDTPLEISDDNRNAVNAALGFTPDVVATPGAIPPVDLEKRKRQNQTLCEFMGHGMAVVSCGLVAWSAKQFRYETARPSPKQLKELGEAYADQFKEWFTDIDLKPWHRIVMLMFVIGFGMCAQGHKMPTKESEPLPPNQNAVV